MGRLNTGSAQAVYACLAGEIVFAAPGATRIARVEVQTRQEWEGIFRQILEESRLGWTGGRLREGGMVLLFGAPDSDITIPVLVDVERAKGVDGVIRARLPGLAWRMGALEFRRMLERLEPGEKGSGRESKEEGCRVYLPAPFATRFTGRRFGLREGILANPIAVEPGLQELVIALRAQYLNLQELLQLTTISQRSVVKFLAGLRAAGLLVEAPRQEWDAVSPYRRLGLHWTSHEFELRTRYRELREALAEESRKRIEEAYELLHRPDWRRAYRERAYPPPMIREVTNHLRRQLAQLRCGEDAHYGRIIDLSRRILELDPEDGDVRKLLTTLLTRSGRSQTSP